MSCAAALRPTPSSACSRPRRPERSRDDPYPYGVKSNRQTLDTLAAYSHEQGLTPRQLAVEEVFAPSTLDL